MRLRAAAGALFSLVLLGGCTFSTAFQGPEYDPKQGVTAPGDDPVMIVLTHAMLHGDSPERRAFWANTRLIAKEMPNQPGLIGYALRMEFPGRRNAWTMTAWRDQASLNAFIASPAHQRGIRAGQAALADATFARVLIDRQDLPLSWDRAVEILATQGTGYR